MTFYPSVVVNFRVRFDEAFQIVDMPAPSPQGGSAEVDAVSGTGQATQVPLITQRGTLTHLIGRIPKGAGVELPGYRTAGRFNLEFDWRELPIDPRLLRAVGVEIFIGAVKEGDFASGMVASRPDGRRIAVLNTLTPSGLPNDDALVLFGSVDTWSVEHDERGSVVRMEGRDARGLFLDSPIDPAFLSKLDLTRNIQQIVQDIIDEHPTGKSDTTRVDVVSNPDDWPDQTIPSPGDRDGLTRVRRKGDGSGSKSTPQGGDKLNFWDIITQYCTLVGAVPFFRGRELLIRPGRSLFDQSKLDMEPGFFPFVNPATGARGPRVGDDGRPYSIRKLIYGRNLSKLSFERKYAGAKVPVIEVASIDTSSKVRGKGKLLVEVWPPSDEEAAKISGVSPTGDTSQTDKVRISLPGIRDRKRLLEVAKNLYEEIGRGELGGMCQTKSLSSFGGDNSDADLCRIRPGDAVEFGVDARALSSRAPLVSELTDHTRRSFEDQVNSLKKAMSRAGGVDENLIRVLVASARSAIVDMLRFFRVCNVRYGWALDSGLEISFDFQNYFTPRSSVTEQTGANVAQSVGRKDRARKKRPKSAPSPMQPRVLVGAKDRRVPIATSKTAAAEELLRDKFGINLKSDAPTGVPSTRPLGRLED